MSLATAIQDLHRRCAIYTSGPTASRLLDLLGWTAEANLSRCVLLEPCVGEGSILLEGVRRLIMSFRTHNEALTRARLLPRIKGFELHRGAATTAKRNVKHLLIAEGFSWPTATALADAWVLEGDFLLQRARRATHVAANPPYVRWGKLPAVLAKLYRTALPGMATRGDVAVAFLYRMQQWADDGGKISALVSDRWLFAQYASEFLNNLRAHGWLVEVADERPENPFIQQVGAYSAIVRLSRAPDAPEQATFLSRVRAREHHRELERKFGTLVNAGCQVRVGPALGAGRTFVVDRDEDVGVENELVRPFVDKADLGGIEVDIPRRKVIVPYSRDGRLIDPNEWPGFLNWAAKHQAVLRKRSHFAGTEDYWRTIDAIPAIWTSGPKLLLPELCKTPVATLDTSGALPAHSIYAIWPGDWPIGTLQRVLNSGLLELTAAAEAPRLRHGWVRFYKRFILRTPLPTWNDLSVADRESLQSDDPAAFGTTFTTLFGFPPGAPPLQ